MPREWMIDSVQVGLQAFILHVAHIHWIELILWKPPFYLPKLIIERI